MKRVALISAIVVAVLAVFVVNSQSSASSLASKANIAPHAPHGHASSHYLCGEMDLKVIYNRDIPAIEFNGDTMPIKRVKNDAAEQYSSKLNDEEVLLTILDHAATLTIGDKTYEACEKIACVPLLPEEH